MVKWRPSVEQHEPGCVVNGVKGSQRAEHPPSRILAEAILGLTRTCSP